MAIPLSRGNPDTNQLWVSVYSQKLESDALSRSDAGYYYSCGSLNELREIFDGLIRRQVRISRLLFDTHGKPGQVDFGNQGLAVCNINGWLESRNYEKVFNADARIMCNGCNVGEGASGSAFLARMGQLLLGSGGIIKGWTSVGFASLTDGHVMHLWGDVKTITINRSGQVVSETLS